MSGTLNLVQRAIQQDIDQTAGPAAGENAIADEKPVAQILFGGLTGDQKPIETPVARSGEVQLNLARCREEGILSPGNMETETHNEFRIIKRRLLLSLREEANPNTGGATVLVTSALPSEGKTFTALNLALTLAAERDLQVLLIEGDVVNPSFSRYFTTAKTRQGLTDLLNGNVEREEAVMHACASVPNLSVIFAGAPDPRTPELMASPRMPEILSRLHRSRPDLLVVIDCSPVISPEPSALAPHVSHGIMVVAAGQSSRLQLREALDHMAACPSISLVFNKSPRWRKQGSYYQYNYGYGAATHAQPETGGRDGTA